ncbi:MAG: DUF45 domain-containing protein [Bacilli bacterium]|nr:DUF45 domain-containing protein [Bacilli bacterium]
MFVTLGENTVEVIITRKNNKNIYFRFSADLKLHITCNIYVTKREILKLIEKNELKLLKMYESQVKLNNSDAFFNYLGKKYIKVEDPNIKNIYFEDGYIYYPSEKKLNKFIKEECIRVFNNEVERCKDSFSRLPVFTLKIRNMKTRWGVCNRRDNIVTLNSELLKKDIDLIDYVIIHELCHFYEGNHSKRFWDLVSDFYPKYKDARKRLKEC